MLILNFFISITLLNKIKTVPEKILKIPIAGQNQYSCFVYVSMKKIGRTKFYITLRNDVEKYFGRLMGPIHELKTGFKEGDFTFENCHLNSLKNFKYFPDTTLWSFFNFIPNIKDEQYSFLHSLKNENHINKVSFSFDFHTGVSSPVANLYLGGVPLKLLNNTKKTSFNVNLNVKKKGWFVKEKVKFIEIKFNNNTNFKFDINDEDSILQFDINEWGIICLPNQIFEKVLNFGFKNLIENEICEEKYSYWNAYNGINCDVSKLDDFPIFNFKIGNKILNVDKDRAFYNDGKVLINKCKNFIIGKGLMKSYEAVEFDYENNVINLFEDVNNNIFVDDKDENDFIKKSFISEKLYFLVFCFVGFGIGFYFLKKRKMKKKNYFFWNIIKNYTDGAIELL